MPFTPYRSKFDADTLRVLHDAFDMACLELLDLPEVHIDEQMARDLIARRIVAAAHEHGERDPDRLVRYALEAFET
jgi:hypothetical protein